MPIGQPQPRSSQNLDQQTSISNFSTTCIDRDGTKGTTMLCTRCLRATATAAATTTRRALPTARYFTTSPAARNAAEPALSTPTTKPGQEVPHPVPQTRSVCKEGTILTGLNFIKGKEDPVALRDEQYPEWLWSCLDSFKKGGEEGDEDLGDEFGKSRVSWCEVMVG